MRVGMLIALGKNAVSEGLSVLFKLPEDFPHVFPPVVFEREKPLLSVCYFEADIQIRDDFITI